MSYRWFGDTKVNKRCLYKTTQHFFVDRYESAHSFVNPISSANRYDVWPEMEYNEEQKNNKKKRNKKKPKPTNKHAERTQIQPYSPFDFWEVTLGWSAKSVTHMKSVTWLSQGYVTFLIDIFRKKKEKTNLERKKPIKK